MKKAAKLKAALDSIAERVHVNGKRCEFYDDQKARCREAAEPGHVFCAKHRRTVEPR